MALTNATMPYVKALASKGWKEALSQDAGLAQGLNTHAGKLTNAPVGLATGHDTISVASVLA
jgi:alanine dehydrogenase